MIKIIRAAFENLDTKLVVALGIGFFVIVGISIILAVQLAQSSRQQYDAYQEQQFAAPEGSVRRQVRRVLLERINEQGETEYVEILNSGQINRYDANMNLIKSGMMGYYRVDNLFNRINRLLSGDEETLGFGGKGKYKLIIDTNQGTTTIIIDDDGEGDGGDWDEIIDEIEDVDEGTFSPTPTPLPTVTPVPGVGPSPTPTPTLSPLAPTPTPTIAPGEPTPLPDYMTADPFTCEDVHTSGRPITVSQILCGLDQDGP